MFYILGETITITESALIKNIINVLYLGRNSYNNRYINKNYYKSFQS